LKCNKRSYSAGNLFKKYASIITGDNENLSVVILEVMPFVGIVKPFSKGTWFPIKRCIIGFA
jgi:hypothetical protein